MNPDIFRSHDEPQSALTAPVMSKRPTNYKSHRYRGQGKYWSFDWGIKGYPFTLNKYGAKLPVRQADLNDFAEITLMQGAKIRSILKHVHTDRVVGKRFKINGMQVFLIFNINRS